MEQVYKAPNAEFKIVVIKGPNDNWDHPVVREMFHKIVSLKLRGYGKEYPYGVMCLDTTDFICDHLAICQVTEGDELKPVLAYKSIELSRAETFKLPFSLLTLVQHSARPEDVKTISKKIEEAKTNNHTLRYCSAYTIDPEIRFDKAGTRWLQRLMGGMHANFHLTEKTGESTLLGVTQFKVDKMFETWGYKKISEDYNLKSLNNTMVGMLSLTKFSDFALSLAEEFKAIWDERIEIGTGQQQIGEEKKAA